MLPLRAAHKNILLQGELANTRQPTPSGTWLPFPSLMLSPVSLGKILPTSNCVDNVVKDKSQNSTFKIRNIDKGIPASNNCFENTSLLSKRPAGIAAWNAASQQIKCVTRPSVISRVWHLCSKKRNSDHLVISQLLLEQPPFATGLYDLSYVSDYETTAVAVSVNSYTCFIHKIGTERL